MALNALFVEPDESYCSNVRKVCFQLGFHGQLGFAETPATARLALREGEYQVVVVNARLKGPETAREVLEMARDWQPNARRILVTDWEDATPNQIANALALAHDVWDKAWDANTLRTRFQIALKEGLFETAKPVPAIA